MSKTRKLGRTPDEGVYQLESSVTYEIGSGGDYATLNEAIEAVSKRYPIYKQSGVRVTLQMVAGFVMAEQVLVDGIDLSWITITGVDATTPIVRSALDTGFEGRFPAFGVTNGGFVPVISQLFNMDSSGSSSARDFLNIIDNSHAIVMPNAGCTNAGSRGVNCTRISMLSATGINISNAGEFTISCSVGSIANISSSNMSNSGSDTISCTSGATVVANGADCTNSGRDAIRAVSGGYIIANNADASGANRDEIKVEGGSIILANGSTGSLSQAANTITSNGLIIR